MKKGIFGINFKPEVLKAVHSARLSLAQKLYGYLLPKNRDFLHKLYKVTSIEEVPKTKMKRCIEQMQAQIKKDIRNIEKTFIRIK